MQNPEEKKRTGKHLAPEPDQTSEQDVIRADTDIYGDETDIPIRTPAKKEKAPKKKAPSKKAPAKKSATKKTKKKKNRKKKARRFLDKLSATGKKTGRKTRVLLETVRSDSKNPHFKTVMVYGHRVPFWPMIALILVVVIVALVFMNNSSVSVDEQTLTVVGLSSDLEDYNILVISDLNGRRFGDEQSALLRVIDNLDYDAVFFLGDMVGESGDAEPFYELLDGLSSSADVYFICGDSDPGPYVDTPRDITGTLSEMVLEDWILGAIERGATYVDSPVCLTVGDSNIWLYPSTLMNVDASELVETWEDQTEQEEEGVLAGLEADYNTLPITSYRYKIAQEFYEAFDSMDEDDFYIVLAHEVPSEKTIEAAAEHDTSSEYYLGAPDLILAGHYCGGVWQLPILGAFYVPDNMLARNGWFPAQSSVYGLSTVGESQVYITSGLSTNSDVPIMAFRLFNQPQISLLTLTATLPESMLSAE